MLTARSSPCYVYFSTTIARFRYTYKKQNTRLIRLLHELMFIVSSTYLMGLHLLFRRDKCDAIYFTLLTI